MHNEKEKTLKELVDEAKQYLGGDDLKSILLHDIGVNLSIERRDRDSKYDQEREQSHESNKLYNSGVDFTKNFLYTSFEAYEAAIIREVLKTGPSYICHAMLGRRQYLSEYLRLGLDERRAMYKKISRQVKVFESKADKAEVLAEASKLLGVELSEEKLVVLKQLMNEFMKLSGEDVRRFKTVLGE